MANKPDSKEDSAFNSLDLTQLQDLSFGPDWASEKGKKRAQESYRDHDGNDRRPTRDRRPGGGNRDRRSSFPPRSQGQGGQAGRRPQQGQGGGQGGRREGFNRRDNQERGQRPVFEPTVDTIFVSQDKPFEVLLKAMRTTHKTYELFEIARIILGKENRFIAIVSPKEDAEDKKLYLSVPDQLPFESRDEAINHVMNNHLDKWFEIEEIEVEPPSGNFQMINRCKLTGELLAPPNFHRYQEILKEHYSKNIRNMPWERFLERIESVKDPEVVQEWMDKMKKTYQYTLKQKEDSEEPKVILSAAEDVRYYLTTERKNEVFVTKDKIRLPGDKLEKLPKGTLRRSIERELENQRRFPLVTSNHLRGRLRRCNLNFFKKGSKGITFVCAVKRKPRYKDTVFSESIQDLINYIEKHPKISVEDLLKDYKQKGVTEITEDTQKAVIQDLRWLVGAGYVSEYGNSTLFAEVPLEINAAEDKSNPTAVATATPEKKVEPKPKAKAKATPVEAATEEATETPVEVAEGEVEAKADAEAETEAETETQEVAAPVEEAPETEVETTPVEEPKAETTTETEAEVESSTETEAEAEAVSETETAPAEDVKAVEVDTEVSEPEATKVEPEATTTEAAAEPAQSEPEAKVEAPADNAESSAKEEQEEEVEKETDEPKK